MRQRQAIDAELASQIIELANEGLAPHAIAARVPITPRSAQRVLANPASFTTQKPARRDSATRAARCREQAVALHAANALRPSTSTEPWTAPWFRAANMRFARAMLAAHPELAPALAAHVASRERISCVSPNRGGRGMERQGPAAIAAELGGDGE